MMDNGRVGDSQCIEALTRRPDDAVPISVHEGVNQR